MQLVIVSNKTRVRDMEELRESEQDDLYSSDTWIYHKDWNLKEVIHRVRKVNDSFRKEDEIEEGNEDLK